MKPKNCRLFRTANLFWGANLKAMKYKYALILMLIFIGCENANAQSKFSATAGWGFYELANVGVQWNYSQISSLSLYGGTNFKKNETSQYSVGLSFDQTFRKPIVWKIKSGYSVGTIYWTSDNELYYFKNLSFPFMALLSYPFSNSFCVRIEGGMLFNAILQSDRKQNVEAGYPERFNGNVRLGIIYKLGSK
jgi:hypothetical protein